MFSLKNRILSVALSLIMLSSSLGINIYSHICHSMGRVDISIISADSLEHCSICMADGTLSCEIQKSCCDKEDSKQKKKCCEHKSSFHKLDFDSINYESITLSVSQELISSVIPQIMSSLNLCGTLKPDKHFSGISPPFSKNYLHFISMLIE